MGKPVFAQATRAAAPPVVGGRALSVDAGLGSGTVLQCLYRLENWGWLESRWEDREMAARHSRRRRRRF